MEYACREERGKYIDPDNRIIARTTDADFFLITHRSAPLASRYEIRSKSRHVSLSLSNSTAEAALSDLRVWARNHNRCLLTYSSYQPQAQSSK